jgi:arylsulfatase
MAGNTPFQRYKQFTDLGGVRSPLVVSWPRGIAARGAVRSQFVHAVDIAPTVLSLLGEATTPMDGVSIAPTFDDAAAPTRRTQYWETLGHRAIWHDGWKAVTVHEPGRDFDDDRWRLYRAEDDFAEATDLANVHPDKLEELKALWWREARAHDVLPLDDRSLVQLIELQTPLGLHNRGRIVLRPGQSVMPSATQLTGSHRTMRVTAYLRDHRRGHQGVLLASGCAVGGYSLYVRDGILQFEHLSLGQRTLCRAEVAVCEGLQQVGFRLQHGADRSASIELLHGDAIVGCTTIPRGSNHLSFWGLSVCADLVSQVSRHYDSTFSYPHDAMDRVEIDIAELAAAGDVAALILATE